MKKWMEKTAKSQRIKTDEEMDIRIAEVMKVNENINKHNFKGKEEFCQIKNDLSDSVNFSMA